MNDTIPSPNPQPTHPSIHTYTRNSDSHLSKPNESFWPVHTRIYHTHSYDVTLCMNVTDVDDKIILRAHEQGACVSACHGCLCCVCEREIMWEEWEASLVKGMNYR